MDDRSTLASSAPGGDFVGAMDVTIAPDPLLLRPVRLALGGVASLAGFDVEAIDDLRVAVNELVATLIERGDGSPIRLRLETDPSFGVRVTARTAPSPESLDAPELTKRFHLSEQILSVLADDHGFHHDEAATSGWFERACDGWDDDLDGGGGDRTT